MAEKKKDPAYKEKFLASKKESYYTKERKKRNLTGIQSGRGVLTEQRNKMLSYMSNAAQKDNTNYTEIIKDGKFLGVKDNAAGINFLTLFFNFTSFFSIKKTGIFLFCISTLDNLTILSRGHSFFL